MCQRHNSNRRLATLDSPGPSAAPFSPAAAGQKIIYIAPLKALVRERMEDWGRGLCRRLGKRAVELTGDYTPDLAALMAADVIISTPEKWDGISRNWQTR